jgi:hypothetical protein
VLGSSHQGLDVPFHLENRPGVARGRIERPPAVDESADGLRREREPEAFGKIAERLRGNRGDRLIAVTGDERGRGKRRHDGNALEFGANGCARRRLPCALGAGE